MASVTSDDGRAQAGSGIVHKNTVGQTGSVGSGLL